MRSGAGDLKGPQCAAVVASIHVYIFTCIDASDINFQETFPCSSFTFFSFAVCLRLILNPIHLQQKHITRLSIETSHASCYIVALPLHLHLLGSTLLVLPGFENSLSGPGIVFTTRQNCQPIYKIFLQELKL